MVLAALASVHYETPTRVWCDDQPPTLYLIGQLGHGVEIYGPHPTRGGTGLVNAPNWHLKARCFSAGADVFYGDEVGGGRPVMRPKVLARARALCRGCPVAHICLTSALANDERYGVWGGTSGRNRDAMRLRLEAGETIEDVVEKWLATL